MLLPYQAQVPRQISKMRSFICLVALGLFSGVQARCEWYLEANDCICMNSTDGSLARTQTVTCCKATGYKTTDNVGSPCR
ncbi:hypothetical protein QBC37DRAFT_414545 [Rhypophila decipiens]|uniref:Uncharacterized protein n=1 Tax=Rhypophila decipiens TaxID=261697 RepID=A0AAN6YF45_9PEZI|nr:hypothetical protein QBC37DRAFT_414545 [Rhypophila decipiens]